MDREDLAALCTVFLSCRRENEALSTLHELIECYPDFDKRRRILFQGIYKQVIDSLRAVLYLCTTHHEYEVKEGNEGHILMLEQKKEENCARLLALCKDGIGMIDQYLLPNTVDVESTAFFEKMKGDFYRYVAEFSDESESINAESSAEEAYTRALSVADQNLPRCCPTRMGLILNMAVFKFEIKKDTSGASEMLETAVEECNKEDNGMSEEDMEEVREIEEIMRQNLDSWSTAE